MGLGPWLSWRGEGFQQEPNWGAAASPGPGGSFRFYWRDRSSQGLRGLGALVARAWGGALSPLGLGWEDICLGSSWDNGCGRMALGPEQKWAWKSGRRRTRGEGWLLGRPRGAGQSLKGQQRLWLMPGCWVPS